MQQKRLILALLISTAILFSWSYLFPVKPPSQEKPAANLPAVSPTATPANPTGSPAPIAPNSTSAVDAASQVARRNVRIKTPLYEAKLDSLGSDVVSWIIKKNKDSGREIYSVAGDKNNKVPLELISPEGLKRQPHEAPLQIITGDSSLDMLLATTNYQVEGVDTPNGDVEITLSANEKRSITFVLRDGGTGLNVTKRLTFDAERYSTDFEVMIKRGDQLIPQVRLKIGPSIGDQGIKQYTFYSVAPEAIAAVGDKVERHAAAAINANKNSPDRMSLAGPVDWAGIGDTYFAMVAIPSKRLEGLEYRTIQYNHQTNGSQESRYQISAFVPIPSDGSKTTLYVGPKDHYILTGASEKTQESVGRSVDLEGLIDYGWFSWLSRPIAVPILKAIRFLHQLTNSYGVAIILFTIVIYSLFFPLKWRSSKAMKKAQKLAPRMKELQEKIKGMKQNDPRLKELQMEQLRLMKEGNPLGGCLPLLIQMPFLFALYRAITISLDFRQATFLWLPDLSAGDPFHVLEFLMAGTMIVLQLITPAPSADPLQRKMMAIGMPLFMLYVLWGAPSGLLLYWLVGNIVGFSQQFLINHLTKSEGDETPPPERRPPSPEKRSPAAPSKKLATSKA
ncbi:MAG: membrane protein insertase YidC [Pyrinomonadaceae bacterium]|nr:membrane protein insertase YidC [Pyrinomonadaceae bacterium]